MTALLLIGASAGLCSQTALADATIELRSLKEGLDSHEGVPGYQLTVVVTATGLESPANGFQVFLSIEPNGLTFRPDMSFYDESIFDSHIRQMSDAEVAPGTIHLDGNTLGHGGLETTMWPEALLAYLVFDVDAVCSIDSDDVEFTNYLSFVSELSYFGSPLPTATSPLPPGPVDAEPPFLSCDPTFIETPAAPGGDGSVFLSIDPPTVTDNFGISGSGLSSGVRSDGLALTDPFPVGDTLVYWFAYDICGNPSSCTKHVIVLPHTELQVTLELPGSEPGWRCVTFAAYDCNNPADPVEVEVNCYLGDHDGDPLTPVRLSGTVPFPIGTYTSVNAKDRQHTKWGSGSSVTNGPTIAVANDTIVLQPGDNDDDGDVDINDLTWLVSTFGDTGSPSCGPEFARDADFNNNGFVSTEDFSLLTAEWLTISQAKVGCVSPSVADPDTRGKEATPKGTPNAKLDRRTRIATRDLEPTRRRADLNGDGVFDWRDVERFEKSRGLPSKLSERLRTAN